MAIVFTKELPTDRLLFAYNNNVIRFYSDSSLAAKNCELTIGDVTLLIYPNPEGKFYYNFKELISSIINKDNFKDDLDNDLSTDEFLKDWTTKIYNNDPVTVKVILEDDTFQTATIEPKWLSGYVQLDEFKDTSPIMLNKTCILTPVKKIGDSPLLKYWKGYPFDFTIFFTGTDTVEFTLLETGDMIGFGDPNVTSRLVMSDGLASIENFLDMQNVINTLRLHTESSDDIDVKINRIIPDCGEKHYLKWINRYGGWNYWLFNKGKKTITPKGMGEVNNDFNNLEDTLSQTINIGVSSKKAIAMNDDVSDDEMVILADLFESPKVYLFTGKPNQVNHFDNWLEVNVKDKAVKVSDSKYSFINIQLDVELPTRVTRTI